MYIQTKYDLNSIVYDDTGTECLVIGVEVHNKDGRVEVLYWLDNYDYPKNESELNGKQI